MTATQKLVDAGWAVGQTAKAFALGFKQFLGDGAVFAREGMRCHEKNFVCLAGAIGIYALGRTASDAGTALIQGVRGIQSAEDGEAKLAAIAAVAGGFGNLILLALPPVVHPVLPMEPPLLAAQTTNGMGVMISTGAEISGVSVPAMGAVLMRSGDDGSHTTCDDTVRAELGKLKKEGEEWQKVARQAENFYNKIREEGDTHRYKLRGEVRALSSILSSRHKGFTLGEIKAQLEAYERILEQPPRERNFLIIREMRAAYFAKLRNQRILLEYRSQLQEWLNTASADMKTALDPFLSELDEWYVNKASLKRRRTPFGGTLRNIPKKSF